MSNLLKTAETWLALQCKDYVSETVVYERGTSSVSAQATFGNDILRVSDGKGNTKIERGVRDLYLTAADLVLGGVVTTPESGDLVYATFGGVVEKYEVMPRQRGEAAWRYDDPDKVSLEIYTKFRGTVAAMPVIQGDDLSLILAEGQ